MKRPFRVHPFTVSLSVFLFVVFVATAWPPAGKAARLASAVAAGRGCVEGYQIRPSYRQGAGWAFAAYVPAAGANVQVKSWERPDWQAAYRWCGALSDREWRPYAPAMLFGSFDARRATAVGTSRYAWRAPWSWTERAGDWLWAGMRASVPYPAGDFLAGLLWAGKGGLDREWQDAFKRAGLSHIVAVSGFNVTIFYSVLDKALLSLSFPLRFAAGTGAMSGFALMAGMGAPVVRSVLMAAFCLYVGRLGWKTRMDRLLLLCFAAMVAMSPYSLRHDAGLHLSFLALLGMAHFGARMNGACAWLTERFGLRESLASCLAANVYTVPYVALQFKSFSLVAPLANVALTWSLPWLMAGGAAAAVLGHVPLPPAALALPWLPARLFLGGVDFFAHLPLAYFSWS